MIDIVPILKIAPIFVVALASPGPDFMMVSSMALSRGRLAGVQAALGIAAGVVNGGIKTRQRGGVKPGQFAAS